MTCTADLQYIATRAIQIIDFSVLWGYRNEQEQNEAYEKGRSKLRFPYSKHNTYPSQAIDLAPYPIDWKNIKRFIYLGGVMLGIAKEKHLRIRWGGDWNSNGILSDENFKDYGHFELIGEE